MKVSLCELKFKVNTKVSHLLYHLIEYIDPVSRADGLGPLFTRAPSWV